MSDKGNIYSFCKNIRQTANGLEVIFIIKIVGNDIIKSKRE